MSIEVLNVEKRETRGSQHAKRMRREGKIPAILYGHQQESVSLTLAADEIEAALRHNAHLFELKGSVSESALIKDVQWDAFGSQILHVDLTRVDKTEAVEVSLEVVLRGVAPGTKEGGVVDQQLRSVDIRCPANAIPENLVVSINDLGIDQSITASQFELPAGAELLVDDDTVVCSCSVPQVVDEDEAAPAEGAEPEVIGAKADEEEES